MKVRWLDLDKPIEYVGKANPEWRCRRCRVVHIGRGPGPRNVGIRWEKTDFYDIVPLGTLRNVKETR